MTAPISSSPATLADSLNAAASAAAGGSSGTVASATDQSQQFLKLLTTQLQNQDPLNPMDNSQMTSQIAQISTVSGIEKLNGSVAALGSQFLQMQVLQGASLVGHTVVVPGNQLAIADGTAQGSFSLGAAADNVTVSVLDSSGKVVRRVALGAQASGVDNFRIPTTGLDATASYTFSISATSGGTALTASPLMHDVVNAVSTSGGTLTLDLQKSGAVAYNTIQAID